MGIEWKNGDECVYMNSKIIHVVIGRDDKYRDSFWCKSPCGSINLLDAACLSKPETQQQREDRERLENGKSLHTAASKTEEAIAHGIFRLWEMEEKETRNHYCQLAEIIGHKTNYRK